MNRIITMCYSLLLFTSCSHIYFQEVQPKGGVMLTEMPKELYGKWFEANSEGWEINQFGITKIDFKTDSMENIIDTVYSTTPLSDSMRIYKSEGLYILNYREKCEYWEIAFFQPQTNGDISIYNISDPKVFAKVKGIKLVEANYTIDDEYRTVYNLDPEAESSLKFESAIFSGQMKLKSLKKVLNETSPTIFKYDGTIYILENDSI